MIRILEGKYPGVLNRAKIRKAALSKILPGCPGAKEAGPVDVPKKVLVIGGGPAGMEAASVLAERGHSVTLCEREPQLGGTMRLASKMPFKTGLKRLRKMMIKRLMASGAEIRLNTEANDALIEELKPDVIISAAGARPVLPEWADASGFQVNSSSSSSSSDDELNINVYRGNSMSYEHALRHPQSIGQSVVVAGSGLTGLEIALWLAKEGRHVVVAGRSQIPCPNASEKKREALLSRLQGAGAAVLNGVECLGMNENGVLLKPAGCNGDDGKMRDTSEAGFAEASAQPALIAFPADSLIAACGMEPKEDASESFKGFAGALLKIGNCVRVSGICDARKDGGDAGKNV